MKRLLIILPLLIAFINHAQTTTTDNTIKPLKLHHAEPLYADLIRDLGARKGEKELNVGFGINDEKDYIYYSGFAEYEFAVADRLGMEVEVPFKIFSAVPGHETVVLPANRVEGIKLATQYTFMVSPKYQTSMAVGYIQEMEFSDLSTLGHNGRLFSGTVYNPIFVAAKRLTPQIHTLLYTGPAFTQSFASHSLTTAYDVNANLHYVFANGNFAGVETNMEFSNGKPDIIIRPQFKVAFSKNVSIGVLAGLPASHHHHHGVSAMTRMIWVP
jgi:hypothetical protein